MSLETLPFGHLRSQKLNLQPLTVPVSDTLPHHMMLVRLLRLGPSRKIEAAENTDNIYGIGMKPHPFEQTSEGVERPLQPLRVGGGYQAIVYVEECGAE